MMYYIPFEMRREMTLDYHVIQMHMIAPSLTPPTEFCGIWLTYQGELYVTEGHSE